MLQELRDLPAQAWRLRVTLALVLVPTVALLVLVSVASAIAGVSIERLLRDPLAVLGAHPLTGFISNVGVILWSAAAGVCFLTALVMVRRADSIEAARFFFWSGALTTLLVFDDTFQVHEAIIPGLLGRGQTVVILSYVALTAACVWRFRRSLLAAEYVILVAAGAFFAVSLGIDLVPAILHPDEDEPVYYLVWNLGEDGAKLIGIGLWLAFYLRTAAASLGPPAAVAPGPSAT